MSGGQPDGVRLLELARSELLQVLLPELNGDASYRARLIANAMKIAAGELAAGQVSGAERSDEIAEFAQSVLGQARAPGEGAEAAESVIRDALRSGALDGDAALYGLLVKYARRRREILG